MKEERLITPGEAAAMLATTPRALDHRRRARQIPFVLVGRLVRYRLSTIEKFISDGEHLAPRRHGRPSKVVALVPKQEAAR